MANINTNFGTSYSQTSRNYLNTNVENNSFSTELLLALIEAEQIQKPQSETSENSSYFSLENSGSGDNVTSFTQVSLSELSVNSTNNNKKFTTVIDWSCYEKILSDTQIAGLSRQYGGELTLTEYAEAMRAIARLANVKNEEDEVLEEMSDDIVYGEDAINAEYVTIQNKYADEFMESLNFYDIDNNTEFFNSDTNIFDEFKLLLENKNYDYVNFFSLLSQKDTDKFKLAIQDIQSTNIDDNNVSIEENSPLNLNKYGGFSHLTPLIVQDIKDKITELKNH